MLSEADAKRVADAINRAEAKTSGEIVAVIADRSGSHELFALMWAALIALLVPWPLIYLTWAPMQWVFGMQLVVFLVLSMLFSVRAIQPFLVPRSVQRRWAHRRAVEQFLAQNMHTTRNRTGVMIFVSAVERYAEIIADTGIYQRVPKDTWQAIVDELTGYLGDAQPADGFIKAIEASGVLLAQHFPRGEHGLNELPNHLIVLR